VFINIQLCQRRNINLKFTFCGKCIRQLIVQTMNSLYDKNIIFFKLQGPATVFPLSRLEIERRHIYFLPCQKPGHIFIKLSDIQCLQTFKIKISVCIPRTPLPVIIIIIQTDRMRFSSLCQKLNRQAVGKCRLSGRRRTCNHDKFNSFFCCNLCCQGTDPFLHQCFLKQNNLFAPAGCDCIIERTDRSNVQHTAPAA